jgi:phage repressor protein C with HTH and peptisase S24 domain
MVRYFSEVNASAGGGGDAQDEEERMLEIPSEFATLLGGANELRHIEALNVSGDSMEPLFSYDDIVFVNKNKTNIQRGGIFVIKTESGLFIKRVWQRVDGAIELISENSVYPVQVLRADAVEVVGRVVGKFGGVD